MEDSDMQALFEEAYWMVEQSMQEVEGSYFYMCPLRKNVLRMPGTLKPKEAYFLEFAKNYKKKKRQGSPMDLPTRAQWEQKVKEVQATETWKEGLSWTEYGDLETTPEEALSESLEDAGEDDYTMDTTINLLTPEKETPLIPTEGVVLPEKRKNEDQTEEETEDPKKVKTDDPFTIPSDHVVPEVPGTASERPPEAGPPSDNPPGHRAKARERFLVHLSSFDKVFYLLKMRDYLKLLQRMNYLIYFAKGAVEKMTYVHWNPSSILVPKTVHHPFFQEVRDPTRERIARSMECIRYF